ncbi:MAG TPA: hypothetical protein VN602_06305 [Gemmatimonadaceae bacterium]|nr:hypothetical protein [Gemmatimonadaceae bacterium]
MVNQLLITLALLGVALLLGATAYESVVMAPNYEREIPPSIDLARQFLKRTTPAHYFRILAPLTLLVLAIDVIACWHVVPSRGWLLGGLGSVVVADTITFAFHYPRLKIMFKSPLPEDSTLLRRATREWAVGNYVRLALLAATFLFVLQAFAVLAALSLA